MSNLNHVLAICLFILVADAMDSMRISETENPPTIRPAAPAAATATPPSGNPFVFPCL